jgi:hypothetical protein
MADIILTFTNDINTSVQVGDIAYYCNPDTIGGFDISTTEDSELFEIGPIIAVDNSARTITCAPVNVTAYTKPLMISFILFSKDNRVNMASPLGYYAQARFVNDSKVKGEMFAAACEIFESSK